MSQTVADILIGVLEQIGVKHIFGLIGDSLNPLADAVRRSGIEWPPAGAQGGEVDGRPVRAVLGHQRDPVCLSLGELCIRGDNANRGIFAGPRRSHAPAGAQELPGIRERAVCFPYTRHDLPCRGIDDVANGIHGHDRTDDQPARQRNCGRAQSRFRRV